MKPPLHGYFITGTDTDVGKTIVTAALTAIFLNAGRRVLPVKPVQTGCRARVPRPAPDIAACRRLTGVSIPPAALPLLTTYRFQPACSPHLAAARAGTRISLAKIVRDARRLQSMTDMLIVEGAGGVLVPLNRRQTMLDLMQALGLPVILVSRPNLGAINHALLSLQTLRQAGLTIAGLIFNATHPGRPNYIEADNRRCIPRRGHVRLLGDIAHLPGLQTATPARFLRHVLAGLRLTP